MWDARLTSEFAFVVFYILVIWGVYSAIPDRQRASRAASFLAIVGVVNVPIIYFFGSLVEYPASGFFIFVV